MNHQEFKNKYIGKSFDFDGAAGAQCADVAKAYVAEVHGKKWREIGSYPTNGGVINAFYNYPNCFIYGEDYELIENNPNDFSQIPLQGDLIVWGDYELTSEFGHIAVVDSASKNGFSSIDQNWNAGNGLHTQIVNHNYRGILGWLRLRTQEEVVQTNDGGLYQVKNGGWRSQVIQEIIDAGLWFGTWQENEQKFFELNGTVTPTGGWKSGDFVRYNAVIIPAPVVEPVYVQQPQKVETVVREADPTQLFDMGEIVETTPVENSIQVQKDVNKTLPHWKRSVYDTGREGAYALSGVFIATGGWELVQAFVADNDFSEQAIIRLLLGIGAGLAGYIQALMKEERKRLEK